MNDDFDEDEKEEGFSLGKIMAMFKGPKGQIMLAVAGVVAGLAAILLVIIVIYSVVHSGTLFSNASEDDLLTKEKYTTKDLGQLAATLRFLNCEGETAWETFINNVSSSINVFFNSIRDNCDVSRVIKKKMEEIQEKKDVDIAPGLILSTIRHGYTYQPAEIFQPGVDLKTGEVPLEVLDDILKSGLLTATDIRTLMDFMIFDVKYSTYKWTYRFDPITHEKIWYCEETPEPEFHFINYLKFLLYMRYGGNFSGDKDNWSVAIDGYEHDVNLNEAWEYSALQCKTKGMAQASDGRIDWDSVNAALAYFDGGMPAPYDLSPYEMKADIETDKLDPVPSVVRKEVTHTFVYKEGFSYKRFPYFEKAIKESIGNGVYVYNEIFTPKKIEQALTIVNSNEESINEILGYYYDPHSNKVSYVPEGTEKSSGNYKYDEGSYGGTSSITVDPRSADCVVNYARSLIGTNFGKGFDCKYFVRKVYKYCGVSLPESALHNVSEQMSVALRPYFVWDVFSNKPYNEVCKPGDIMISANFEQSVLEQYNCREYFRNKKTDANKIACKRFLYESTTSTLRKTKWHHVSVYDGKKQIETTVSNNTVKYSAVPDGPDYFLYACARISN